MHSSNYWIGHFMTNALQKRVNWDKAPNITDDEISTILPSLQAWQLGENLGWKTSHRGIGKICR